MGYKDDVAEYAETWDEAKAGGSQLPEGVYQARISVARIQENRFRDSAWQLFVVYEDMGGAGSQPMYYDLDTDIGIMLAKRVTRDLGWEAADEPGALLKLEEVCQSGFFEDLIVEIRVKDKPGEEKVFKQVFINKLLGKGVPAAGGNTDDDIPF